MVGFDDIRFADFPEIGLSTVRQPNYEMGKLTADILLDCIVIATNSQTHCEIICAAAEAGSKYVFTEKPLGMPMEEKLCQHSKNSKNVKYWTHQPRRIFSRCIGDRAHRSGIPCIFALDGSGWHASNGCHGPATRRLPSNPLVKDK